MSSKMFANIAQRSVSSILLLSLGLIGCELKDPVVITYDDADAEMLLNGAYKYSEDAWSLASLVEFVASDEGVDPWRILGDVDETGDPSLSSYTEQVLLYMSHSRELARLAVERARRAGDSVTVRRALAFGGWITVEMARRWGDHPLDPRGEILTQAELYRKAIETFTAVIDRSVDLVISDDSIIRFSGDSIHQKALAGNAWAHWELAKEDNDPVLLRAAIDNATTLLTMNPYFQLIQVIGFSMLQVYAPGTVTPAPGFEQIPFWWQAPFNASGPKLMDADGIRLIAADAHLRLGEISQAKELLKSVTLLPINHVGLAGRDPRGAPLTGAEVDAYVEGLDAQGVQHAIDELWRNNFFAQGRRNRGPTGPIFPIKLPPLAR